MWISAMQTCQNSDVNWSLSNVFCNKIQVPFKACFNGGHSEQMNQCWKIAGYSFLLPHPVENKEYSFFPTVNHLLTCEQYMVWYLDRQSFAELPPLLKYLF